MPIMVECLIWKIEECMYFHQLSVLLSFLSVLGWCVTGF